MVRTRSSGASEPEKTALQLQRDHVTAQMDMNWLYWDDRPHLRSRGIVHTHNLCYQSAVLQALMHQPPFLRWIYQHDITQCPLSVDCLKCHMKRLIQHYWGPGATRPIARNHQALQGIARLSYQNGFVRGEQDCANAFYDWVIHTLMDDPENPHWRRQYESLYCLNLQPHDRCSTCGTAYDSAVTSSPFLNVGVDPANTSISEAITDAFDHELQETECEACATNRTKTRWTEIVAAPKVLRIHLQIMLRDHKIFHALEYPDVLDLTYRQEIAKLPLRYELSSVVAHAGDFVEVNGEDEKAAALAASEALARKLQAEYIRAAGYSLKDFESDEDSEESGDGKGAEDDEDSEGAGDDEDSEGAGDDEDNEGAEDDEDDEEIEEDDDENIEESDEDLQSADNSEDSNNSNNSDPTLASVDPSELQAALLASYRDDPTDSEGAEDDNEESIGESDEDLQDADDSDHSDNSDNTDSSLASVDPSELQAALLASYHDDPMDSSDSSLNRDTDDAGLPNRRCRILSGHYIASVREPDGTFSTVDNSGVRSISQAEFVTNPQRSNDQEFQVFVLTYIRDDRERVLPGGRRWVKELGGLLSHGNVAMDGAEGMLRPSRKRKRAER